MANLMDDFHSTDLDAIPADGGGEPLPEGDYTLQMTKSERVPNSKGTGIKLEVTYEVATGQFEGRKFYDQYNTSHPNHQTQAIAIGQLKAFCLACGVDFSSFANETELAHHKPFLAKVDIEYSTNILSLIHI
jgi:hypothetical protein